MNRRGNILRANGNVQKRKKKHFIHIFLKDCRKIATVSMVAILLSGCILTGCGTSKNKTKSSNSIRIGVTAYDSHDTFISQLLEKFNSYAGSNVSIVSNYANLNQKTQDEQVEEMIYSGCDVICVNLVDRTEPAKIIKLAEENNVPIVFFNREPVEEDLQRWEKLYYVGADAKESGEMQGQLALKDIQASAGSTDKNGDGQIQYVVLEGEAGHQDAIVRTEYSVDTIIAGGVALDDVGSTIANWNREQAQTKITQLINEKADVELILANNDDMALGAIDAYTEAGIPLENIPLIYGIDGTSEGLKAIQSGSMNGTVYNDKEGQAKAMYDLATNLAKGKSVDKMNISNEHYIWLPYSKIDKTNVSDFMR
jgi:methyl-galactoside transport system substrate-binding protein